MQLVRRGVLGLIGLAGAFLLLGAPASGSAPARAALADQVTLKLWPSGRGAIDATVEGGGNATCDYTTILASGEACPVTVATGSKVKLTASAEPSGGNPSQFVHWSRSECEGTGDCTITVEQDDEWVAAIFTPLGLEVGINGSGTVTATEGNLTCGPPPPDPNPWSADAVCTGSFEAEHQIILTATPTSSGDEIRWGPGCDPVGGSPSSNQCVVTMTNIRTFATVAFGDPQTVSPPDFPFKVTVRLTVKRGGAGSGRVSGSGKDVNDSSWSVDCGSGCSILVGFQSPVTLQADALGNSTFVRWTGVCATKKTCRFSAGSATTVTAVFAAPQAPPPPPPENGPPPPPPQMLTVFSAQLLTVSLHGRGTNRAAVLVLRVNRAAVAQIRLRKAAKTVARRNVALKAGRNTVRLRLPRTVKPGWYRLSVKIVAKDGKTKVLTRGWRLRR
jgi:hypothetical protein